MICEHGCGTEHLRKSTAPTIHLVEDDTGQLHTPERCQAATRALLDEVRAMHEGFEAMAYNRGCDLEAAEKRAVETERERDDLNRMKQDWRVAYKSEHARAERFRAALEAIAKMGRVCKNYDTCTHPECSDSCGAALTAINAIAHERTLADSAPEAPCLHLLATQGPDVCVKCGLQWSEAWRHMKLDPVMYGGADSAPEAGKTSDDEGVNGFEDSFLPPEAGKTSVVHHGHALSVPNDVALQNCLLDLCDAIQRLGERWDREGSRQIDGTWRVPFGDSQMNDLLTVARSLAKKWARTNDAAKTEKEGP